MSARRAGWARCQKPPATDSLATAAPPRSEASLLLSVIVATLVPFFPAVRQVISLVSTPYAALHLGKLEDVEVRQVVSEHVRHKVAGAQVDAAARELHASLRSGARPGRAAGMLCCGGRRRQEVTAELCEFMLANGRLQQLTAAPATADGDSRAKLALAASDESAVADVEKGPQSTRFTVHPKLQEFISRTMTTVSARARQAGGQACLPVRRGTLCRQLMAPCAADRRRT